MLNGMVGDLTNGNGAILVRIDGHTDNTGNSDANMTLSIARASAIKAYLVSKNPALVGLITTNGYGDTKPVADNGTTAGRQKNRRVEITYGK